MNNPGGGNPSPVRHMEIVILNLFSLYQQHTLWHQYFYFHMKSGNLGQAKSNNTFAIPFLHILESSIKHTRESILSSAFTARQLFEGLSLPTN